MKIALAAHGRFVIFDYARELVRQHHDVTLLTNYPQWYVERRGIPSASARTLTRHGVAARLAHRLNALADGPPRGEAFLLQWFGRWVASTLEGAPWDLVICMSGIGEETFRNPRVAGV